MNRQQQIEHFLLVAHRMAVARLRAEPSRVDAAKDQLARWRRDAGLARSEPTLREWDRLLTSSLEELERVVCSNDEHGPLLRSVSPLSTLLTQKERAELLRQSRTA